MDSRVEEFAIIVEKIVHHVRNNNKYNCFRAPGGCDTCNNITHIMQNS